MNATATSNVETSTPLGGPAAYISITQLVGQLVGQVYEAAPAAERSHLLQHLLRPMGVLSVVAVANGIFSGFLFRSGWRDFHAQLVDAHKIQTSDVVALVDHAQQVSVESVDALAQMLTSWPAMAGSAAASLLVAVLMKRSHARRTDDSEGGDLPGSPA